MMERLTEPLWRQRYADAVENFESLRMLAGQPVDQDIDTSAAMLDWARSLQALDLACLDGDPAFTQPLLRRLLAMNEELVHLFTARRDAIARAHDQQRTAHKGIKAYHDF